MYNRANEGVQFKATKVFSLLRRHCSVSNGAGVQWERYIQPNQPKVEIGVFGKRRLRYLEHNRKILYTNLLTKGKLTAHLAEVDKQAENMFDRLVKQLAQREGVTEQLKAESQILWVKKMNSIRNRAEEIVNHELIYS